MTMTSDLFHEVGQALYGPRWQSDIAHDLEMSDRHVRRLATGSAELKPGMAADLLEICEERMKLLNGVIKRLKKISKETAESHGGERE